MEGEKYKKGSGKQFGRAEKSDKIATGVGGGMAEEHEQCNDGHGQNTGLAAVDMEGSIAALRADIKTMAMEMTSELGNFQDRIRDGLKKELADISEEIQYKLGKVVTNLKTTTDRVGEAEGRIADIEGWTAGFTEALSQSL